MSDVTTTSNPVDRAQAIRDTAATLNRLIQEAASNGLTVDLHVTMLARGSLDPIPEVRVVNVGAKI